ncbi:hypothetical protein [Flavobacterium sp.]|uniref:hypothetical protein n=1 Tax=Flavobacterium sp. TaxID=239 RepID=UPI00374D7E1D
MKIIEKGILSKEEKEVLHKLWNNEYPARLHLKAIEDFDLYLMDFQIQYIICCMMIQIKLMVGHLLF